MTSTLRIASAQINPTLGDLEGNAAKIRSARAGAAAAEADIVACPELCVLGYPPEDLVLKPSAVADAMASARRLAEETNDGGPALVVGCPWSEDGRAHNAALLLDAGEVAAVRFKHDLPNYGVFDEKRVFAPGPLPNVVDWRGVKLGLPVCEDIWRADAPLALAGEGAEILICINGSPWRRTIQLERREAFLAWMEEARLPLVFVNQIGGQDELVFDGASFSWDPEAETVVQQLPGFVEALDVATWERRGPSWHCVTARIEPLPDGLEADWRAAVLAVGDYVDKNGFPGVVIGLSGGVDSALTAAIATDALGPERVRCVRMPSRYTSQESMDDAQATAKLLGAPLETIDIEPAVGAFGVMLAPAFHGEAPDVTEENIQSRIRGLLLMALSNKFGPMVLATGNKSEMAVGYATIYGDMNGGYNALKDLYKTEVFALARWRNGARPAGLLGPEGAVMPESVITKPPSAELRADQTDEDSLPPYEVLDDILRGLVDREEDVSEVAARGHDRATVMRVQQMLYIAEYKRRQAPPGAKIGGKNFGRDRRYPITNKYRDRFEE